LYVESVTGGTHVINGSGKTVGIPQVDELASVFE